MRQNLSGRAASTGLLQPLDSVVFVSSWAVSVLAGYIAAVCAIEALVPGWGGDRFFDTLSVVPFLVIALPWSSGFLHHLARRGLSRRELNRWTLAVMVAQDALLVLLLTGAHAAGVRFSEHSALLTAIRSSLPKAMIVVVNAGACVFILAEQIRMFRVRRRRAV